MSNSPRILLGRAIEWFSGAKKNGAVSHSSDTVSAWGARNASSYAIARRSFGGGRAARATSACLVVRSTMFRFGPLPESPVCVRLIQLEPWRPEWVVGQLPRPALATTTMDAVLRSRRAAHSGRRTPGARGALDGLGRATVIGLIAQFVVLVQADVVRHLAFLSRGEVHRIRMKKIVGCYRVRRLVPCENPPAVGVTIRCAASNASPQIVVKSTPRLAPAR